MLSLSLSLFYYTGNVGRSGQADRFFGQYAVGDDANFAGVVGPSNLASQTGPPKTATCGEMVVARLSRSSHEVFNFRSSCSGAIDAKR
jgi:hypothetical protein